MISGVIARLRSLWRGLRGRAGIEAAMNDEFRFHLEMRTAELVRRGFSLDEAARQARLEFGHIDSHKEDARASRGLRPFDEIRFSALDLKLGLRMLIKYPGLSVVSVIGMSVAIAIGAASFAAISAITDPAVPLDDGERVVSIRSRDVRTSDLELRALHDYRVWKSELRSFEELGAFRNTGRNLYVDDGPPRPIGVAEITASGFRVARVAPAMGRPIVDDDERPGATPVVVIAHEEWQDTFDGDPGILGRPVRLGSTVHTVVGVMPPGFRFPIADRYWLPLQRDLARYGPREGPSIFVFGRLAPGATLEDAQLELTTIGLRLAAELPATHEHLRAQITPYAFPFMGLDGESAVLLRSIVMLISMLLVLVAVNVAVLVYARTATRIGEIALRTALGASRRRIVVQLFVEALVMSLVAAAAGLTIAAVVLATAVDILKLDATNELPFWLDFGLSAELVAYVVGLAILAAVIVGVLPGLQATGKRVQASLQRLSSRGSQMQLGRMWTVLIVAQVAVAVAVLPNAAYLATQSIQRAGGEIGYPAEELLQLGVGMLGAEAPPGVDAAAHRRAHDARLLDRKAELIRRLEAEPGIAGVTFTRPIPDYPFRRVEGESAQTAWAHISRVDVDLFSVYGVPITGGREFTEADLREGANRVIVNRVFAEKIFGGGNVLGRRIRYVADGAGPDARNAEPGPWFEIVGVVRDYTTQGDLEPPHARVYEPVSLAGIGAGVTLSLRVRGGSAMSHASRIREIVADVEPDFVVHDLRSAADLERRSRRALWLIAAATVVVVTSVLLLSAAGIYAMMSFTVARRRREIGIRSALGADARRILTGIFARACAQLGAGLAAGLLLAAFIGGPAAVGSGPLEGNGVILLPAVATIMIVVGLAAALGPARRGLAIQPTEALKEE